MKQARASVQPDPPNRAAVVAASHVTVSLLRSFWAAPEDGEASKLLQAATKDMLALMEAAQGHHQSVQALIMNVGHLQTEAVRESLTNDLTTYRDTDQQPDTDLQFTQDIIGIFRRNLSGDLK